MAIMLSAARATEKDLLARNEDMIEACTGMLRAHFGADNTFWCAWEPGNLALNTQRYTADLQRVFTALRNGLLRDHDGVGAFMQQHPGMKLENGQGYRAETDDYVYFLQCDPKPGDFDCHCYCYDKAAMEQVLAAQEEEVEMEEMSL